MKKIVMIIAVVAAFFPLVTAQTNDLFKSSEEVLIGKAEISVGDLPKTFSTMVNARFDNNDPSTWTKLPLRLNEYGWLYEYGDEENVLNHYKVSIKTTNGSYLEGTYSEAGDLVESREIRKDVPVPSHIIEAFNNSQYKDWKIVGNKEVVSFNTTSYNSVASQNFKLTLEKGKKTKKMAFDYEASSGKLTATVSN